MFYILNEANQVIAADDSLLNICGVSHINELFVSIARGDITFDLISDSDVNINTGKNEKSYKISKTLLSSLVGNFILVSLSEVSDTDDILFKPHTVSEITDENTKLDAQILHTDNTQNDDVLFLDEVSKENIQDNEEITFGDHPVLEDDASIISEDSSTKVVGENVPEIEHDLLDESALFDITPNAEKIEDPVAIEKTPLVLDLDEETSLDISQADTQETDKTLDINIDIQSISEKIGVSTDDYNTFLNEFIDTALELEKDLQNDDIKTRSSAVDTLSYLSSMLHLPVIGNILSDIANANPKEEQSIIELFYTTLSRITTSTQDSKPISEQNVDNITEVYRSKEEKLELFDEAEIDKETTNKEDVSLSKSSNNKSFGEISLEGIKPKHFDFQLEEAANDLSLPVELIEEFVHDFIEQALIETTNMVKAYKDGDLDKIQKIGHLLKGASSNLRINTLSDTLYKIQFCEDPSQLEELIKDYWAHFLSFENQINVISN